MKFIVNVMIRNPFRLTIANRTDYYEFVPLGFKVAQYLFRDIVSVLVVMATKDFLFWPAGRGVVKPRNYKGQIWGNETPLLTTWRAAGVTDTLWDIDNIARLED